MKQKRAQRYNRLKITVYKKSRNLWKLTLDVPAHIRGGYTLIPNCALLESMGLSLILI